MEWLMPVDSLQQQEGRLALKSCARASGLDYRVRNPIRFRMNIKNSKEQRKTARRAAVFSTRRPRLKDFCGEGQIRR